MLLLCALASGGCHRVNQPQSPPRIAAATSYLEAVAGDLLGSDIQFLRLAEPGACPGHFDIRPSDVQKLRGCKTLLRFDFQKSLDARLDNSGNSRPSVCEVSVRGGMARPDTYFEACCQVAAHLTAVGMLERGTAELRLNAIKSRLEKLACDSTNRLVAAVLTATPVVASQHQRDFCEWLGFKVVASYRAADVASISEINHSITAGKLAQVKLVIANLPEGRRTADALAGRLNARVVVLENFPASRNNRVSFDEMVAGNVDKLLRACQPWQAVDHGQSAVAP